MRIIVYEYCNVKMWIYMRSIMKLYIVRILFQIRKLYIFYPRSGQKNILEQHKTR